MSSCCEYLQQSDGWCRQIQLATGRRSYKWWHRIFYYLLDLAVICAFVMYKTNKRAASSTEHMNQLHFRLSLARELIGKQNSRKLSGHPLYRASKRGGVAISNEVRMVNVGKHMPSMGTKCLRCRYCSTKEHDKRTRFQCTSCELPLYADPCFALFHR